MSLSNKLNRFTISYFHPSLIFAAKANLRTFFMSRVSNHKTVACTIFMIVTYDCNDNSLYYKTTTLASLTLPWSVIYDCKVPGKPWPVL